MQQVVNIKWLLLLLLFVLPQSGIAQFTEIRGEIEALLDSKRLTAGIALRDLTTGDTLSIHGGMRLPMQSVFKFPIALTALKAVDEDVWRLDDSLYIAKQALPTGTWSPLRERYPEGNIYITLAELIQYTVSHSDNNGCDILLQLLGSPSSVNGYMHSIGITDIAIEKNEAEMHLTWEAQFSNWTTPQAMIELLRMFEAGQLLKSDTQAFLWETMTATTTGSVRAKLPAEAIVAHKTGSSGRNAQGVSAATNDIGILVLPSGKRLAYAVFITDSTESDQVTAEIISDLARLLYNEYPHTPHHE